MSRFRPDYRFDAVEKITPDFLKQQGIKGLALDLDNTLAPYKRQLVGKKVALWLAKLRTNGIGLVVLSNARHQRVAAFCAPLGLPFVSKAKKPGIGGFHQAANLLKLRPREMGMVGDQLFTDIRGAKRSGCRAILVSPISLSNPFYRIRSWLERPFLRNAPLQK